MTPPTVSSSKPSLAAQAMPCRVLGDWQLCGLLAASERTEVFAARPANLSSDEPCGYAVKVLRERFREDATSAEMFACEVAVGGKVCHPHLVPVLDAGTKASPHYLVMPLLAGRSLREELQATRQLEPVRAIWFARQLAEALAALHAEGWSHGDVKAENIHVSNDGHLTLLDLGFVRPLNKRLALRHTHLAGTLETMAPEVITSPLRVSAGSDVYSLGIVLYEMLAGRMPFVGRNEAEWVTAHREEIPRDIREVVSDLPERAAELLHRMLAKDPMRRPASAYEVVRELVSLEIETFAHRAAG